MNLFRNTDFLFWLGGAFLLFLAFYFKLAERKQTLIDSLFSASAADRLIPEDVREKKRLRDLSLLAGLFFMILAASGPQWQREFSEVRQSSGNILIAVDTSLSMSSSDIKPTRLESAKIMIKALLNSLYDYRIALMAFQGNAYMQCPMTSDSDAVAYSTEKLSPDMLPFPGTNLAGAVTEASDYLASYDGDRMLVLITDGEDHEGKIDQAISYAVKNNLRIFAVGVGTEEGDLLKDSRTGEYKKDKLGHTVVSKLDENTLIKMAHQTQGQYIRYSNPDSVSEQIKKAADGLRMSGGKYGASFSYKNHYQIPLLFAFLLILVEFVIMEEKTGLFIKKGGKYFGAAFLILFFGSGLKAESPGRSAALGNSSYKRGDYSKAYDYYRKSLEKKQDDKVAFNTGNALYKLEQYPEAEKYYESVKTPKVQSRALYNLGNLKYMSKDLEGALDYYRKALLADPNDRDAAYNLQVALMQKNDNKNKQDEKQDKKNDKSDKDKNKGGGGGDGDKDKDKKNKDKGGEQNKDKNRKAAEQLLNMMKEKEKENQKAMAQNQNAKSRSENFQVNEDW